MTGEALGDDGNDSDKLTMVQRDGTPAPGLQARTKSHAVHPFLLLGMAHVPCGNFPTAQGLQPSKLHMHLRSPSDVMSFEQSNGILSFRLTYQPR